MFNLIASVTIPQGNDPFNSIVFGLLQGLTGFVGYGVAVILFAIILRLFLFPLDILNKYFSKRNAAKAAEFKEEEAELKAQYGADPMKFMAARREMYRRNGHNPMISNLAMFGNTIVTMLVFFAVFSCLNQISSLNINIQSQALHDVYIKHEVAGTLEEGEFEGKTFREELNDVYSEHTEGFIWVHNIFRADTWASKRPSLGQFRNAVDDQTITEGAYNTIFSINDETGQYSGTGLYKGNSFGWNGYLIFLVIVPATMFFSMQVNTAAMQKKKAEAAKKEAEVGYSMRQAKAQADPNAMPQVDPQKMMKYMKFIMPAMMIMFVLQSATSFAIYISVGAIIQTTMGLGANVIIDKIIKRQEQKKKDAEPNHPIINPHTRYFKKRSAK